MDSKKLKEYLKKNKLTPAQRAVLQLKIARAANKNPEFATRVQARLDEIAEKEKTQNNESSTDK